MKKLFIITLLSVFSVGAFAQEKFDTRRKIEVTGSAEAEVTPDIIYVNISLKEYMKDSKNKVDINTIEHQLVAAVQSAGIPKENFTINNVSSYNYIVEKKKNPDFLAKKQYRLKLTDLNKYNTLLAALDPKSIEYTNIDGFDYSKIEELKKSLKIKALQAAKEKATYLVTSIGDKLGSALDLQEINNEYYPQPMYRANVMMKSMAADGGAESAPAEIDFKKIKLNYQMKAVFEIVK